MTWHFIHPFNLILVGLIVFPSPRWLQDRMVLTEPLVSRSLINFISRGFESFANKK
jgi:hypothetical protein